MYVYIQSYIFIYLLTKKVWYEGGLDRERDLNAHCMEQKNKGNFAHLLSPARVCLRVECYHSGASLVEASFVFFPLAKNTRSKSSRIWKNPATPKQ